MTYDVSPLTKDFSPTGLKLEGMYENDRNVVYSDLYKAIIREAYDVTDVICGHHLIYVKRDTRPDGFTYEVVQEVPSADALIFDHDVARKIWGKDWQTNLCLLAQAPVEGYNGQSRDEVLHKLYYNRGK